jgi:hypothetical protein
LVAACGTRPTAPVDDGAPDDAPAGETGARFCTNDEDCPLGHVCRAGVCEDAGATSAGLPCASDADCGEGFLCAPSTGLCVARTVDSDPGPISPGEDPGDCEPGATAHCGESKVGECRWGLTTCTGERAWGPCLDSIGPSEDVCDGRDNDCDSAVDEDYDLAVDALNCGACGVVCAYAHAEPVCAGGRCAMGPCDAGFVDLDGDPSNGCEYACAVSNGAEEACDGRDNDCDGATDEEQPDAACGAGECRRQVASCAYGAPVKCVAGDPAPEVCDGKDNDCDSSVDEALGSVSCGVGECAQTVESCVAGVPQSCAPGSPVAESCDGRDNDCDGSSDEDLGATTCGVGECLRAVQNCVGGVAQVCSAGSPTAEACDGLDTKSRRLKR